ncbi:HK97 family phage prohead protease [Sandaracinobacter neustonicus]|uniref:HK97 family phage prohead protease n=1 Tax=Sandaracinobacter neustonicus TaxID=1715348 RepID=A0A501XD48_9SPHN|nr:HK97 family phage prohead protease [Sandaracinobacter neustonicus]TPE58510.1 HK97 family phage prohead protease [Sandaracinobacter neustonicus]
MDALVRISGYVSRFDSVDRGGDIVRRAAFLGARADVPLLWQHDPARPIGRVLSLTEDGVGLKMLAGVSPDCRDGEDALALMRSGAVDGLSFGYRVKSARPRPGGGRELLKLELIECSVVTLPMHGEARVSAVG